MAGLELHKCRAIRGLLREGGGSNMPATDSATLDVKLFGLLIEDPALAQAKCDAADQENRLARQFPCADVGGMPKDARIARIYAFSIDGEIHELPKSVVMTVQGPGTSLQAEDQSEAKSACVNASSRWDVARGPTDLAELSCWNCHRGDLSIRFDCETGPVEQILLDAAQGRTPSAGWYRSGISLRSGISFQIGNGPRSDH